MRSRKFFILKKEGFLKYGVVIDKKQVNNPELDN